MKKRNLVLRLITLLILNGTATFAVATDHPDPRIQSTYNRRGKACLEGIPLVTKNFDVASILTVRSPSEVKRKRDLLMRSIWKDNASGTLTDRLPDEVNVGINWNGARVDSRFFSRVDELVVSMKRVDQTPILRRFSALDSHVYVMHPSAKWNKRVVLFHQGHGESAASYGGNETVTFLLSRGFTVAVFQMPLYGDNKPGGLWDVSHNPFAEDISPLHHPLRHFIEPIVVANNYFEKTLSPKNISMIGISGGGWTTTVAAAVDPRILKSFPVAGSLPHYIRTDPCSDVNEKGDWEQNALYPVMDYLDLYVLGSAGTNRQQVQILNQFDDCCFWGVRYRTYADLPLFQTIIKAVDGTFAVYLDSQANTHTISPHALVGPVASALGVSASAPTDAQFLFHRVARKWFWR